MCVEGRMQMWVSNFRHFNLSTLLSPPSQQQPLLFQTASSNASSWHDGSRTPSAHETSPGTPSPPHETSHGASGWFVRLFACLLACLFVCFFFFKIVFFSFFCFFVRLFFCQFVCFFYIFLASVHQPFAFKFTFLVGCLAGY